MMKVIEHEHPLKLVDLQVKDEDLEESDEEEAEEDLVPEDEFSCSCKRCGQVINEYYRYFYKCTHDACDFSLHKFCAELPTTLKHTSHMHPLTLCKCEYNYWECDFCQKRIEKDVVMYKDSFSDYICIDVNCGVEGEKRRIYHPGHPHPLVSLLSNPILCRCRACGKKHEGVFFQCTTCSNYAIHIACAFLPKRLLIQRITNAIFTHTHPLTLSYSFTYEEHTAKYFPRCRVCNVRVWSDNTNLWIYKCEKCIYYVHLACATNSSMWIGRTKTIKNFKDADYPNLLRLPFPDQPYNIPKHVILREPGPTNYGTGLQLNNHQHELILVDTGATSSSSSSKSNELIMCHNPMKKIQVLCNGCVRPIMEMPFYKCKANANEFDDESCNFALHEWCTRLPTQVHNHPAHPQHTLSLLTNVPHVVFNTFECGVCRLPCNGYAYGCVECGFYVDVTCGFIPDKITHESHPNHLLSVFKGLPLYRKCLLCRYWLRNLSFRCTQCNVGIHPWCALFLPETVRHPYDKHPMHLSYLPIENHKSEYFCEICEEDLNPHRAFYHCYMCSQSMHSECAPLILQCETETQSFSRYQLGNDTSIYRFLNVKFGSIHKIDGHPHPVSFAQGIENDGGCTVCAKGLRYSILLRCLECRFAVHIKCAKRLNNS